MARRKFAKIEKLSKFERSLAMRLFEAWKSKNLSDIKKLNLFIFKLRCFLARKHTKDGTKIVYTACIVLPRKRGAYPRKVLQQYKITPFRPRYPSSPYVYLFAEDTKALEKFIDEYLMKKEDRKKKAKIINLYSEGLHIFPYLIMRSFTDTVHLYPSPYLKIAWKIQEKRIIAKRKINASYGSEIAKLRWIVFSRTRSAEWKEEDYKDMQEQYLSLLKAENKSLYYRIRRTKEYVYPAKILRAKEIV